MKIDLVAPILGADDKPIEENGEVVPVGTALKTALLAGGDSADDKVKRFDLWFKLKTAGNEVEISVSEAALLDKAIAYYPTLIFGRLSRLLSQQ